MLFIQDLRKIYPIQDILSQHNRGVIKCPELDEQLQQGTATCLTNDKSTFLFCACSWEMADDKLDWTCFITTCKFIQSELNIKP